MYNQITLMGNVGKQPEIREAGNTKVATLSLGVTERGYTTKDGKKVESSTTWFRVNLWKGLAEVVEKYVSKGDKLFIVGKMLSREYENKDGVKCTSWEVLASELQMLTPKKQGENNSQPTQSAPAPTYQAPSQQDDDLPF